MTPGVISLLVMANLVRWETPFTESRRPSVGVVVEAQSEGGDILKVVVAPFGLDSYPKYLIDFGNVIGFTCMEEAFCPPRDFDMSMLEEKDLSAYEYLDSSWVKSYEGGIDVLPGIGPLRHYLIFGGDNNVEVISRNVPTVAMLKSKTLPSSESEI